MTVLYIPSLSVVSTAAAALLQKSRSDSNIIATVNTATRQVLLVSTPRDYFVPLSISGGQRE